MRLVMIPLASVTTAQWKIISALQFMNRWEVLRSGDEVHHHFDVKNTFIRMINQLPQVQVVAMHSLVNAEATGGLSF